MDAPSVAVSPDGKKLAVAWMDGREGERAAWLQLPTGKEIGLAGEPETRKGHPNVAMDAAGGVFAVWDESGESRHRVYGLAPGAERALLLSGEDQARFPVIAWSERTGAVVAYETSDGARVLRWPRE